MEVLQCDGCDFRAESYDDLKAHIQDVHTAFLQPTEVVDGTPDPSRSVSPNSLSHPEDEEEEEEDLSTGTEDAGLHSMDTDLGQFSNRKQRLCSQAANPLNKSSNPFFQCKFCVRYFRSESLLIDHTRKVHGAVEAASENRENSLQTAKQKNYNVHVHEVFGKVFSCQYCTFKFTRRTRLRKHQKKYHSDVLWISPGSPTEGEADTGSVNMESENEDLSPEEPFDEEAPQDHVVRRILDTMYKCVSKSSGNLTCEWCDYQTHRQEMWYDHMKKKHGNMLKIMSSLQEDCGSSKSGSSSHRSTPTSNMMPNDLNGNKDSVLKEASGNAVVKTAPGISPFQYSQISAKVPNSTGSSILSERSTFVMSDISNSAIDLDTSLLNDSRSSSEDELGDMDDPNYRDPLSAEDSTKLLLSEEDNKMLETKGIPFRRHMNRFQCPFCSFLTMHRRSISRHIENIHLSGKATVYKCDDCAFICTSPLKLESHKQNHIGSSSDWDTMDLTFESPEDENETTDPLNGESAGSKINGKNSSPGKEVGEQNPHQCTLCNFSTMTLKGLRVHQQHKHSYCDNILADSAEGSVNEQQDTESETNSLANLVQKTQTSIWGNASKKHLVGKTARKSINDQPLDLSPVKKRTRIDEIANNLQSKINQNQQHEDMVINLEDLGDDEDEEKQSDFHIDRENDGHNHSYAYNTSDLYLRESGEVKEKGRSGKRKRKLQAKGSARNIPVQVTVSDDEDNENNFSASGDKKFQIQNSQDSQNTFQEPVEYTEEPGTLFYCKHCDYQNKSARSVSTHYQRMHPFIKFSFRYILDPEDQSAVFRCLECFIEYTSFNDLNQHYMEHHPGASNVLNLNQPNLIYMCRFCSYTSPNVRSLMPHYQRMHPTVKINNAMIFSSYMVEQPQKSAESQTLREILNSGPKSFTSSTPVSRSSSSPSLKTISKVPESCSDAETLKETVGGSVVVYDCDMCSFASPNMHSVLVHYQKKHPEQKASYFRIQKTMRVISVDKNQAPSNSFNLSNTPKSANTMPLGLNEEVYYCKHCVYSNRSVVGVLVHYQKRHPEIKVTAKYIKHASPTPGLMKLMDELQIPPPKQFFKPFSNNGKDASCNSSTKGGTEKSEEEMLFFCQHCDYGNRTVKGVLIHYQKKHKEVKANADLVRRHTAVVRSQRERAQMSQTGAPTVASTVSTSDNDMSQKLRSLKCRHCTYTSPYVYALRKHLKKDHPTVKATAMTILNWGYQDSILEAGYHCEWCIYSHVEPSGLLMHYQRRHPEHNVDYTYMASKLWAGPDASQQGANSETKHYQCRDCAYEACSIWDITNHYQTVHPWAIKVDESVLLDIIKGNRKPEKMHSTQSKGHIPGMSSQFDNYQADHEEGSMDVSRPSQERQSQLSFTTTSISSSPYQCTVCLSEYNSLHGLLTHYGKKHPGMKVKAADFAHESDINPSSVYKCRHCPYVNSRIHGVLTHYQKRHPLVKVTAEDFADDIEQVKDLGIEGDEKCKTQRQGYGAYRCKMCPYTHGTLEKLKIHYEKYHNQPASDMFNLPVTQFSTGKEEQVAECSATNVTDVQDGGDFDLGLSQFEKGEKHAVFRCQLCKYFCSTRKGIARHYRIKHNNVRAQPEGKNNVFKCALCPYTNPIRKGLAAHYQKRHDIDAYYTHCLAASKALIEKPTKVMLPLTPEPDGAGMSEELRLAVERRKCSLCAFQAFSRKSIVSHYIKRHPGVFPKRQHASKLGRYFTIIYPKETDKSSVVEENESVEVKPEAEQGMDLEWLPFKCLKCHKLCFSSADLLCMHYNDYHSRDLRRDFITFASPEHEDSEFYQCAHCEFKFLALTDLTNHLMDHNEETQKRAMRQERRKQLQSKQRVNEQTETKQEKLDATADKTPLGYRCNFCVEVHPTLRAICNHLRKHVQYGEAKEGQLKLDVTEVSSPFEAEGISNGNAEDSLTIDDAVSTEMDLSVADMIATGDVSMETGETPEIGGAPLAGEEKERRVGGHPCAQCDRVFMSMQGLRSHERSHSAMALFSREDKYNCQYCQFVSPFRHNLDRHIQSHHGHHKPFRCKLCPFKSAYLSRLKSHLLKSHAGENPYKCLSCSFSTITISQLKEHSLRVHGEMLTLPKLRAGAALRSSRSILSCDPMALTPEGEEPGYLEPADVQQQLSHYQLASRNQTSCIPPASSCVVAESRPDNILTCEFCEFSSGYMQSLRRHYRDRHGGKKLFKCKDCSFFTCYKSTFTIHVEAGHTSAPEEGPKDLRCPFCLYHTKYKSNMIDHVVLHREERVVPLEVSRSKLSRHLQGVVFRCHKCTFTCSSDESLQLHIHKHDKIKPYQCQLCYYDSKDKQALENHLRDEHKVIRNFEIMGRVSLDQLEAMKDKMSNRGSGEEEEVGEGQEEEGAKEHEEKEDVVVDNKRDAQEDEESDRPGPTGGDSSEIPCSPSCGSIPNGKEKRFPCEFCGRSFTNSAEWERHVLRHGMSVNDSSDASLIPAIGTTAQPLIGSALLMDKGASQPSSPIDVETEYPSDLSNSTNLNEKNKECLTKNDL